ncbi:hypothetical protein D3C81_2045880 [compost metagenome]
MMATTLIEANQNSNSPNALTENRLRIVIETSSTRLIDHDGTSGSQKLTSLAPAMASSATTTTQKYQYIQPLMKPRNFETFGLSSKARRAYS